MKPSRVKQAWSAGKIALGTLVKSIDPVHTEVLGQMEFDFLWYDLEHSDKSVETFAGLTRAARIGGVDVLARPAKGESMRMGRLLEAGAQGIMVPRVESADEAREAVRWAKFHPLGERGFDGGSADNNYGHYPAGDYTDQANAETWILAQVESPAAVEETAAIAAVDGIDGVFFGPGDFSVLSGRPGEVKHPETLGAAAAIARATIDAGKIFGTLVFDMDHARHMRDLGARLLIHGADVVFYRAAYAGLLESYRDLR